MHRWTTNIHKLTRFTTARTLGKPPPSPLYYSLWLAMWVTSKCHFLGTPKSKVSKFLKLGLPPLWRPKTFCVNIRLRWGLKQSFISYLGLSNYMWHATYAHVFQVDSWFLVVANQIDTLTLNPSFGHNLYHMYSNGS